MHPQRHLAGYVPQQPHPGAVHQRERARGVNTTIETISALLQAGNRVPHQLVRSLPPHIRGRVARGILGSYAGQKSSPVHPGEVPPAFLKSYGPKRFAGIQQNVRAARAGAKEAAPGATDVGLLNPVNLAVDAATLGFSGLGRAAVETGARALSRQGAESAARLGAERFAGISRQARALPGLARSAAESAPVRSRIALTLTRSGEGRRAAAGAARETFTGVAKRHPVVTGAAAASPVIGTAANQRPSPGALTALPKAQAQALIHDPAQYIKRTAAFVPGAIAGLATAGVNVGASAISGNPKYAKRAFEGLVASNKEFLGYLSSNPKTQKALAEKYGGGPFAIGALSARGARIKRAGPSGFGSSRLLNRRLNKMVRVRSARDFSVVDAKHNTLKKMVTRALLKGPARHLPDDLHRSAVVRLSEGDISLHSPAHALEQIKTHLAHMTDEAKTQPGEAQVLQWLGGKIAADPKFIEKSGLATATQHFIHTLHQGRISDKVMGPIEQRVATERLLAQHHGITHPEDRVPGLPGVTRGKLLEEAKQHSKTAGSLKTRITRLRGERAAVKNPLKKNRLTDQIDHAEAQLKAEKESAVTKGRMASPRINPMTPVEQKMFLKEMRGVRKTEELPTRGAYVHHEYMPNVREAMQTELLSRPTRRGLKVYQRKGVIARSGLRNVDMASVVNSTLGQAMQRSALGEHRANFKARWQNSLTRDEVKQVNEIAPDTFRAHDDQATFTYEQLQAMERAGIRDPKGWAAVPVRHFEKILPKEHEQLISDLALPVADDAHLVSPEYARSRGERFILAPREAVLEYRAQVRGTGSGSLGAAFGGRPFRFLRHANRLQSAMVLATSVGWVPMQMIAEGVPTALAVNPLKWAHYLREWDKLTMRQKAGIGSHFGGLHGFGQVTEAMTRSGDWTKDPNLALSVSRKMAATPAGRFVRAVNPFTVLRRADVYKGVKFRTIAGVGSAEKVTTRMLRNGGKAWIEQDRMAARLAAAKNPHQRLRVLARMQGDESVTRARPYKELSPLERAGEHVIDMLGDWTTLTRHEQIPSSLAFFYPMLRYTTRFLLHGLPKAHPIKAAIIYSIAQQNTQEVRKLLGGEDPSFLNQISQGVLYTDNPTPVDVARASPGGQAVFDVALNGADLASLTKFFQPIFGIGISAAGSTDPFTGKPIVPPNAVVTGSGEVLTPGPNGKIHGGIGLVQAKIAVAALLRLPAGVRLAEQLWVNPRPKPDQIPFAPGDKPRDYGKGPSQDFYNKLLPSGGQKAAKSVFPPVLGSQSFARQRALQEYIQAGKQIQYFKGLKQPTKPSQLANYRKWELRARDATLLQRKLQGLVAQGKVK